MFHVIGAFAQMEREVIGQRTKEGMKAAKQRGARIGRPALPETKIAEILELSQNPKATVRWIAQRAKVAPSVVQRILRKNKTSEFI